MKKSIFLGWLSTFVVVSVIDYLWHSVVFAGFYNVALTGAAYLNNGVVAPLIPFLVLGDALMAIIFVYFIPQMGGNNSSKTLAMRGGALGLLLMAHLAVVDHAIVLAWSASIIIADGLFGLVTGVIVSYIVGYFYRKATSGAAHA